MKVTVAIDSLKGSLTSKEAGDAIACGILRAQPTAEVRVCPLADGGEGTTEAILSATGGVWQRVRVQDPLGRPITAAYGIIAQRKTAVMEMSAAAGLPLLAPSERDPMITTTYGVGEMIADALSRGCRRLIMGIGGSATNDGGVGMLQALGFSFLDSDGKEIERGARGLERLARISIDGADPRLCGCEILVACDVTNPLCGERGCSVVFAPQKGAGAEAIEKSDRWLRRYARMTQEILPFADPEHPGAGAAGGMGFALLSYLGATLRSGIELIADETGLEDCIREADVIVTGEGRLDGQSCMGKAPIGIARLGKRHNKTVIAFAGGIGDGAEACNEAGIDAYFPIIREPCTLEEAMEARTATENLRRTAEQVFRLLGR